MVKQDYIYQEVIYDLINYAGSTLRLTKTELRAKFSEFPICVMDYIEEGVKEDVIEIRFDKEQATLSCIFDKNLRCNYAFLFFDDQTRLDDYVNQLNSMYKYDYVECQWRLPDCHLSLKRLGNDICMVFSCF
ncbi:MAG: hypothetical protein LBV74_20105 [Tannerella sp.]|jgi:hypothetical protein|nr:hypothetical protein [Tannerella sp.]